MSSGSSNGEPEVHVMFENIQEEEDLSIEPPMEQWSSLVLELPEVNEKKLLLEQGLFYPGSGEICTKYIPQSASSVFRHPYYDYPAILDPGIKKALLQPEDIIEYPNDGQELYLAICKQMNQCPVQMFYRNLVEPKIDLKYYGVNPNGVRAMAIVLINNKIVTHLDLTDNFLNEDACYHLGEMLSRNRSLVELNMAGCRIKPIGLTRLLNGLTFNRTLKKLILNRNNLEDEGAEIFANAIKEGMDLEYIGLGSNGLTENTTKQLVEAMEYKNNLTGWDLSGNHFYAAGLAKLLDIFAEKEKLEHLDLSWNSLWGVRTGSAIGMLLKTCPKLKYLNLSRNNFDGSAIKSLTEKLKFAKKLELLDLTDNPIMPADAVKLLSQFQKKAVRCKTLLLDNITVNKEFMDLHKEVMERPDRESTVITHGECLTIHPPKEIDMRVILMKRAAFLAQKAKNKKKRVDIAIWVMEKYHRENIEVMMPKQFLTSLRESGAKLDDDLIDGLSDAFFGGRSAKKEKFISIKAMSEFCNRMWPEKKLAPTPPSEPEPTPVSKGKKGKKRKKDDKKSAVAKKTPKDKKKK